MTKLYAFIAAAALALGIWCACSWLEPRANVIEIVQDGTVLYSIDLNGTEDRDIRISAPDGGYNLVKIQNGTICISEADCPDQTCVETGRLKSDYLPIVCLPHKLIVRYPA